MPDRDSSADDGRRSTRAQDRPIAPTATPGAERERPRRPWNLKAATGVGSLPGIAPDEAARIVAGELPDLPHLVELPDRGVGADLIGRTVGLLVDIFGEVVPSGWRISRRPGLDTRRAQDFLAWDLDAAELHFAGAEWLKLQACGPWTLAAGLEVPSGNRALTDAGAVDDLAESLLEGLRTQLAELGRRFPNTGFVVQLDEPSLPAVQAGTLPTASGFGSVRAVEPARIQQVLGRVTGALSDHPLIAHCCHPEAPLGLLRSVGFSALSIDFTAVGTSAARLDPIGEAAEAGTVLVAGLLPGIDPSPGDPGRTSNGGHTLKDWAAPLLDTWNRLGLARSDLASVVPSPTCGLAGAGQEWAIRAMATCRELSAALQDLPEGWS